ncbi:MAG: hypothetical protein U0325_15985 [Polyangiales bacterium]
MKRPRMRPTFEIPLTVGREAVLAQLRTRLQTRGCEADGSVLRAGAELHTRNDRQHFWSPTLSVQFEARDGAEVLRGRFAPSPSVWMLFIGVYGIIAMGGVAALMYGISQVMLGWSPWAFWGVPASMALGAFVYGAVFIGQGLGAEEMHMQRSVVEHAVDDAARAAGGATPPDAQG